MKKSYFAILALAAFAAASALFPVVASAAQQLVAFIGPENLAAMAFVGATASADVARAFEGGERNHWPVIAADIIFEGSAVGDNASGYARPLVAGDPFRGFAVAKVDNSLGAAGALNVEVRQRGRVQLAIGSLAITDVGKPVYASDDSTFTLTSTSNSYVGRVVRFVSSGVGVVEFDASRGSLGAFTALTDNSTGTASDTIAAITDAATKNAVASLAAKINAIQAYLA